MSQLPPHLNTSLVTISPSIPLPTLFPTVHEPPTKRQRPSTSAVPTELGKFIVRDAALIRKLGWATFVQQRRGRGDFTNLQIKHPAASLLKTYKTHGVPIKFSNLPWSSAQLQQSITRGPHRSCYDHVDFLHEEFIDMIKKEQWVIIPFSLAKSLPGLRLSPPGVIPQRERQPRWICDYTWYGVNEDTLPLAPLQAMQFGHALDRFLRELLLANPAFGPVHMLKLDISDGYYRINLNPSDIPKLGVIFPTAETDEPLVALPLVLPMGWKNSPPSFCAATETIADIANTNFQSNIHLPIHHLEAQAQCHDNITHTTSTIADLNAAITQPIITNDIVPDINTTLSSKPLQARYTTKLSNIPLQRDPCLPAATQPRPYVDVFVDDFIGMCQIRSNINRVRRILLHAVDSVFRPLDSQDIHRREPISVSKLRKGDVSWSTIKNILGWIINSVTMTLELPPHRQQRLGEILGSIPLSQKRTSAKKWHKLLGELRSMALALPGARNLFSTLQNALKTSSKTRIALKKGVHDTIQDFRWLHADICNRPTRIAELIPLDPSAMGYHDAAGIGAGGVWHQTPELAPRTNNPHNKPLLWRYQWPQDIIDSLVTDTNPTGTVSNSALELAGGLLHLDVLANHSDIRERTVLSKTDNLATLFWQRKGSASTDKVPAHLLRLFGIHQRMHRYVPRHDYMPGPSNPMADDASRLFSLNDSLFLNHFNFKYPQVQSYNLVQPTLQMISSVTSALRRKTSNAESLWVAPLQPIPTGQSGSTSPLSWASTPYSKPSSTKFQSYRSSSTEFDMALSQPQAIKSSLDHLKTTYGLLHRRTSPWGPQTPDLTMAAR